MLIASNTRLPQTWTASSGESGRSVFTRSAKDFLSYRRPDTVWMIDCDPRLTYEITALSAALPFLARPIVCVDLIVRRPEGTWQAITMPMKRYLLRRVSHYIHYFKDLRAYEAVYGIGPDRSSFVPFKANLRHRDGISSQPDGEYVLCLGRSMRDFDTFFSAVERLPYPAAIARPNIAQLRAHGARFTRSLDQLPPNVRILDDDGSLESLMRILAGARLVVVPVVRSGMPASIGITFSAMLMGKCVIGSDAPGMSDIFPGMALIVPPEDANALCDVIRKAWNDDDLRLRTANAGHDYAVRAGGQAELYQRIIDQVVRWYRESSTQHAAGI